MANSTGDQKYELNGLTQGSLLSTNDIGTSRYELNGLAQGFLGTSTVSTVPMRTLLGVGI